MLIIITRDVLTVRLIHRLLYDISRFICTKTHKYLLKALDLNLLDICIGKSSLFIINRVFKN